MALIVAAAALATASIAASVISPAPEPPPLGLADALGPSTWAMELPSAWLAAAPEGLRRADRVDLLAFRPGDRAYAVPIAYALRVMSVTERGLVLEVGEYDAIALATARAGGLLIVPIVRSTR